MLTKNHDILTAEVLAQHIITDATVLGGRFGLPLPLVEIYADIRNELPSSDAKLFSAAIPGAVNRNGKDLTRVHWQFLASEFRALPTVSPKIQAVIDHVIAGMDLLASGREWPDAADAYAAAADAAYAAYADRAVDVASRADAANHAARAAVLTADATRVASAAYSAANAAHAVRAAHAAHDARAAAVVRQKDTILRLIAEAA